MNSVVVPRSTMKGTLVDPFLIRRLSHASGLFVMGLQGVIERY